MSEHTAEHAGHHVVSPVLYVVIWATLIILTFVTAGIAHVDLEVHNPASIFHGLPFNAVVALVIATFKMSLVILFFMHGKYSSRLVQTVIVGGFFWLLILLLLTMADYLSRVSGLLH
jgi:cytochrome c oxidase subunit IV